MRKDFGFAEGAVSINVGSGNQDLPLGCRALYIGGAGNLAVTMWDGGNITFTGLQAGTWLPIRARTVLNSGTTATAVIALL
jgi:hypothetical protein